MKYRKILSLFVLCVAGVSSFYAVTPTQASQKQETLPLDQTDKARTKVGELTFLGAVVIPPSPGNVGGLSGISVLPPAKGHTYGELVIISDSGRVFRAMPRWSNGRLTGADFNTGAYLLDTNGQPPKDRKRKDAESILHASDGTWVIGFEHDHRLSRFQSIDGIPGGTPEEIAVPDEIKHLPANASLESLTQLSDGRLFTIAEATAVDGTHKAWLQHGDSWQTLSYVTTLGFVPSDMARLPDGDVVVVERGFSLLFSFRTRIALIPAESIVAGSTISGKTLAILDSPMITENFEGVGVSKTPSGDTLLYLVSDNNFNAAQRNIIVAFSFDQKTHDSGKALNESGSEEDRQ